MRKFLVFLFVSIFLSPNANLGNNRSMRTGKPRELTEKEMLVLKTVKEDTIVKDSLSWKTARASYYDPYDRKQTKNKPDGLGASDRRIGSGSISLGSSFTERFIKKGIKIFIQIKDCDIITPYGKGIFRVDDTMGKRFNNKRDKFFIDFFRGDLDYKHRQLGRFFVQFRILENY